MRRPRDPMGAADPAPAPKPVLAGNKLYFVCSMSYTTPVLERGICWIASR
jgi:hypothetical protein